MFAIFALLLTLVLPVSPVAADTADEADFTLNIMHMNDTHANVENYPGMISAIKEYRGANEEALLFHGGDVFSGTLYYTEHKGQADVALMNLMGIDAMVFGNHEFDEGSKEEHHETLSEFVQAANFPFLGTNIDFSKDNYMAPLVSGEPFAEDAEAGNVFDGIIKEVDGEKIGVFGLTTEDTVNISSPNHVTFSNYIEEAQRAVDYFESIGINKIVAVNHIGYNTGTAAIGNDLLLAENVDGIDIIVGGHSHTKLEAPVLIDKEEPTVIVQADQYAQQLGTLEVDFDENGVIVGHSGELLATGDYEDDEEALEVLKKYKEKVDELANTPVCSENDETLCAEAMKDLENPRLDKDEVSVRANETELGNLITDAMLFGAQKKFPETVIAVQNGGGIRAPIAKGPITVGEVISVLPFGNDPVIVELSGEEIKELLERSVKSAPAEDGGFLHVAGMKFEYDSNLEPGERVHTMKVEVDGEWEEITPEGKYLVTTNGFTGEGGDDHEVFARAFAEGRVTDIGEIDWEQLANYMIEGLGGEVNPELEGRIVDTVKEEEPEDPDNGDDNGNENENENNENNNGANNGNDEEEEEGKELPATATNMYNFLLIGGLLLLGSAGIFAYRRLAS